MVGVNRKRVGAVALVTLLAIAGAPFVLSSMAPNGIELPAPPSAQKLAAMLDFRSPGEREKGALAKIKAARPVSQDKPRQRALGKIVQPKAPGLEEFAQAITPTVAAPPVLAVTSPTLVEAVAPAPAPVSPGGILLPPVLGGGGGPPGGPGTPGTPTPPNTPTTPGTPTTPEVPPVTPPIPEPATWMMMLLGFGLIGWTARRRGGRAPAASLRG